MYCTRVNGTAYLIINNEDSYREGVGYVTTQMSCILFIMLTTTCFGHRGPSSGHKNVYRGKLYRVWS